MRRRFATAALCVLGCAAAAAEDWGTELDPLIAEPGTTVTFGEVNGGDPTREVRLASGVSYIQSRHAGKTTVMTIDRSGHGAVACAYRIYLAVRGALAVCGAQAGEIGRLDTELARIEAFMIANARPLTTPRGAARRDIAAARAQSQSQLLARAADKAAFCASGEAQFLLGVLRKGGEDKLKPAVDDLLSAPRPAAMNPCL